VQKNGHWIETDVFDKQGNVVYQKRVPNPMLVEMRQSANAARLLGMEFGLTPAAATRVVAAPRDDKPQKKSLRDFIADGTAS
jgi:phage terminase small subunit